MDIQKGIIEEQWQLLGVAQLYSDSAGASMRNTRHKTI